MNDQTLHILEQALSLPASEKAALVDRILASLDQPDARIDEVWRREVEDRVKAHQEGQHPAVSLEQVLEKFKK